jgi:hypothetical protein
MSVFKAHNDVIYYVEIKCQLDATDEFLLQILLLAQHVSGTFMPIIRSSRVLYKWLLPAVNTTGGNHLYNTVELLMMGMKVPETC